MLDHSCLLFINSMWSGSRHDSSKIPIVMAGGLGETLPTGRVLDYQGRSDDDRKLCGLYLSLMDRMDVHVDRFGDTESRLNGLWELAGNHFPVSLLIGKLWVTGGIRFVTGTHSI